MSVEAVRYAQSLCLLNAAGRRDATAKAVLVAVASKMRPVLKRGEPAGLPIFWPGVSFTAISVEEVQDLAGLGRTATINALRRLRTCRALYRQPRYSAVAGRIGQRHWNGYWLWAHADPAHRHETNRVLHWPVDHGNVCDRRQQNLRVPPHLLRYEERLTDPAFRLLVHIDRAAMLTDAAVPGSKERRTTRLSVCAHLLEGEVLRSPIERQGAWVRERREAIRELYDNGLLRDRFVRLGEFVTELRLGEADDGA